MIVLVVVVDGFDAGRTPALNDAPTDEMPIVPPAEDDSFQRSQPPASGPIETAKAQVERYWEVKRGDTLSGICAEYYGDAGLFPALEDANGLKNSDLVPGQTISLPPRAALTSNRPQTIPPDRTTGTTRTNGNRPEKIGLTRCKRETCSNELPAENLGMDAEPTRSSK